MLTTARRICGKIMHPQTALHSQWDKGWKNNSQFASLSIRRPTGKVYVRGKQLGKGGRDFPENIGVFINSPGFVGIYSGFQNLKFLADIRGKIGNKEIRNAMEKVGLDPENKTKVDNYSLGMKQKLGLAQAIMEEQDILVLDEPFNALDIKTYEDVKAIIRMLTAEGKTIFLTSHHYKDIEQLCSQIYMIEDCNLLPVTEEIAEQYREIE